MEFASAKACGKLCNLRFINLKNKIPRKRYKSKNNSKAKSIYKNKPLTQKRAIKTTKRITKAVRPRKTFSRVLIE